MYQSHTIEWVVAFNKQLEKNIETMRTRVQTEKHQEGGSGYPSALLVTPHAWLWLTAVSQFDKPRVRGGQTTHQRERQCHQWSRGILKGGGTRVGGRDRNRHNLIWPDLLSSHLPTQGVCVCLLCCVALCECVFRWGRLEERHSSEDRVEHRGKSPPGSTMYPAGHLLPPVCDRA